MPPPDSHGNVDFVHFIFSHESTHTSNGKKYRIGWFFISQTLGGIDDDILKQLRSLFFGFGLALGDEFRKLGEFAGGDQRAMELYQSFRNPL